jgi:hypothetical protein
LITTTPEGVAVYNGDLFNAAPQAKLALRRFRCEQQASRLLLMAMLCSFQGPERAQPEGLSGWSLKTQQYAPAAAVRQAAGEPAARRWHPTSSRFGRRSRCAARPPCAKSRACPRRGDGFVVA